MALNAVSQSEKATMDTKREASTASKIAASQPRKTIIKEASIAASQARKEVALACINSRAHRINHLNVSSLISRNDTHHHMFEGLRCEKP